MSEDVIAGAPIAIRHNHGPNFGRYVPGCERCHYLYPDGPDGERRLTEREVRRVRRSGARTIAVRQEIDKIKVEVEAELKSELEKQMREKIEAEMRAKLAEEKAAMMAQAVDAAHGNTFLTSGQLSDAMRVLGTELRKPDPETEAEKAAAKIRKEKARQDEIKVIMEQKALRDAEQAACNHTQPNGVTRIRGQVHNDGLLHEFCTWCLKEFKPRAINQAERAARGMN